MPRVIHILDHLETPEPDAMRVHLAARGLQIDARRMDLGEGPPTFGPESAGLVLTGGAQMVTDIERLPWMTAELGLVEAARAMNLPVLGICLGAQMIAHGLGGAVGPHPEGHVAYGWHEVTPTAAGAALIPKGLMTLAGNEQGFALPPGAEALATGAPFPNQAFRHGKGVLALQFHPEVTRAILDDWQVMLKGNLAKPGAQDEAAQDAGMLAHDAALKTWLRGMLDRHFAQG
jgi:GMP synthase (glutamine-hydrolysing)